MLQIHLNAFLAYRTLTTRLSSAVVDLSRAVEADCKHVEAAAQRLLVTRVEK